MKTYARKRNNDEYNLIAKTQSKPMSIISKTTGLELIRILEEIPESDRIDALAIAVKVYTEDSDSIQNLRKAAREMKD